MVSWICPDAFLKKLEAEHHKFLPQLITQNQNLNNWKQRCSRNDYNHQKWILLFFCDFSYACRSHNPLNSGSWTSWIVMKAKFTEHSTELSNRTKHQHKHVIPIFWQQAIISRIRTACWVPTSAKMNSFVRFLRFRVEWVFFAAPRLHSHEATVWRHTITCPPRNAECVYMENGAVPCRGRPEPDTTVRARGPAPIPSAPPSASFRSTVLLLWLSRSFLVVVLYIEIIIVPTAQKNVSEVMTGVLPARPGPAGSREGDHAKTGSTWKTAIRARKKKTGKACRNAAAFLLSASEGNKLY